MYIVHSRASGYSILLISVSLAGRVPAHEMFEIPAFIPWLGLCDVLNSQRGPQHFPHAPRLCRAASGRVGRITIGDLRKLVQASFG